MEMESIGKSYFFVKNSVLKLRGWTSGLSLSVQKFLEFPPALLGSLNFFVSVQTISQN